MEIELEDLFVASMIAVDVFEDVSHKLYNGCLENGVFEPEVNKFY